MFNIAFIVIFIAVGLLLFKGIKIVPQQQVWILERMGKYLKSLEPGMHFIVPFIDNIAYKHTLKERAIDVAEQAAITKDNVTLILDGILYVRVINPIDASYGIEDPYYAVSQLAQTSMRSSIGKINLDNTFEERESLNVQIVNTINEAASTWGIQCMRYEIKDIRPPLNVLKAMEMQVAADRQKRADILESEGKQQSLINIAQANKQEAVLKSEGVMIDKINKAKGDSEAIVAVANATSAGIEALAGAIIKSGGSDAVALRIAEQYVEAFKAIAENSSTVIVPATTSDAGSMITQALSIFDSVKGKKK